MIYIKFFVKDDTLKERLMNFLEEFFLKQTVQAVFVEHYPTDLKEKDIVLSFIQLMHAEDIKKISVLKRQDMIQGIVFLSEDSSLVFESFRMNPLHFIRMDYFEQDFKITCEVLQDFLNKNNTMIQIESGSAVIRLNIKSIIYIESYGHYMTLHTTNGDYRIREALSHFIERVNHTLLIKVHKSYIINTSFIEEMVSESIRLLGDVKIPIGRSFKKEVFEKCRNL